MPIVDLHGKDLLTTSPRDNATALSWSCALSVRSRRRRCGLHLVVDRVGVQAGRHAPFEELLRFELVDAALERAHARLEAYSRCAVARLERTRNRCCSAESSKAA
jgi:hypothetical protein